MVLVLMAGAGLGWSIQRATVQLDAVRDIEAAGGVVTYDFQRSEDPGNPDGTPPGPRWLVDLLGIDFFADVTYVKLGRSRKADDIPVLVGRLHRLEELDTHSARVTDSGLAHLAGLSELRHLTCEGSPGLTDAGLAHLAGLERLEWLWIDGSTRIEGPGLAHLAGLNRLNLLLIRVQTDTGLSSLSRLTGLRQLFIRLGKVTDAALRSSRG